MRGGVVITDSYFSLYFKKMQFVLVVQMCSSLFLPSPPYFHRLGSDAWIKDLYLLKDLGQFAHDEAFLEQWGSVKMQAKQKAADLIERLTGDRLYREHPRGRGRRDIVDVYHIPSYPIPSHRSQGLNICYV